MTQQHNLKEYVSGNVTQEDIDSMISSVERAPVGYEKIAPYIVARNKMNISAANMARKMGVHSQNLCARERGRTKVTDEFLNKYVRALSSLYKKSLS